jgi:hypothetical protein
MKMFQGLPITEFAAAGASKRAIAYEATASGYSVSNRMADK